MQYGHAAITVKYATIAWGIDGNPDLALDDVPLPGRTNTTFPSPVGPVWPTGSVITCVFGDLSAQDALRLVSLNGTSGTLTVPWQSSWIRPVGTIAYANKTLTFTLTQPCTLAPFNRENPFL